MALQIEPVPVHEGLVGIYARMPEATLAHEEARLHELIGELGGRIVAIAQVREEKQYEHTLFTQDT